MSNFKSQTLNNLVLRYWKIQRNNGFTLIELMVVFSLMALVSGIGFVSFSSYNQKQIVNQAAQDIKLIFDNAKFNALSSVKVSSSCKNSTLVGYKIVLCSKASCLGSVADSYEIDVMCSDVDSLLYSKKLPQNVTIDEASTCEVVKYNTLSNFVEGGPCEIIVTGYNISNTIQIDSGGNASVQ
jgi:prepilin-type N-terminal cleavage/methylation domain-containing protein